VFGGILSDSAAGEVGDSTDTATARTGTNISNFFPGAEIADIYKSRNDRMLQPLIFSVVANISANISRILAWEALVRGPVTQLRLS
jgi:hypothetical protein